MLLFVDCKMLYNMCVLLLRVAGCSLLFVVCCALRAVRWLLFVVRCLQCSVCRGLCALFVLCWLLCVGWRVLCVALFFPFFSFCCLRVLWCLLCDLLSAACCALPLNACCCLLLAAWCALCLLSIA